MRRFLESTNGLEPNALDSKEYRDFIDTRVKKVSSFCFTPESGCALCECVSQRFKADARVYLILRIRRWLFHFTDLR